MKRRDSVTLRPLQFHHTPRFCICIIIYSHIYKNRIQLILHFLNLYKLFLYLYSLSKIPGNNTCYLNILTFLSLLAFNQSLDDHERRRRRRRRRATHKSPPAGTYQLIMLIIFFKLHFSIVIGNILKCMICVGSIRNPAGPS